jgi:hypothetical protein
VIIPDGVQAAPGFGFSAANNTGFYNFSSQLAITVVGNSKARFGAIGLILACPLIYESTFNGTSDLFLIRSAAATLQFGTTDVNGSAVAQTLRVQSAITGTDQNGANWTFIGSRQTGAGTPGDIIFQTSVKLASSTTQGTPVTGLTITGAIASMQPSVVIGNQALATTATEGFLYIPTCAGTPTGVPTVRTGRVALIYDTTNFQFWIYDGAWKQPKTPAGAALVTWQ